MNAASDTKKPPGVRITEVALLGYLARACKDGLLENGNIRLPLIMQKMIFGYFKDHSRNVYSACGKALCDIYEFSLPKYSLEIVMHYMFEPLVELLKSRDL
jgi:hypothetical protein